MIRSLSRLTSPRSLLRLRQRSKYARGGVALLFLTACGGSEASTATTVVTTAAPTTTVTYSPETLEAIHGCLSATDIPAAHRISIEALLADTDGVDRAIDSCADAEARIVVDNDQTLLGPIQDLLAFLDLARSAIITGLWDGSWESDMYAALYDLREAAKNTGLD